MTVSDFLKALRRPLRAALVVYRAALGAFSDLGRLFPRRTTALEALREIVVAFPAQLPMPASLMLGRILLARLNSHAYLGGSGPNIERTLSLVMRGLEASRARILDPMVMEDLARDYREWHLCFDLDVELPDGTFAGLESFVSCVEDLDNRRSGLEHWRRWWQAVGAMTEKTRRLTDSGAGEYLRVTPTPLSAEDWLPLSTTFCAASGAFHRAAIGGQS